MKHSGIDWDEQRRSLDEKGYSLVSNLLTDDECKSLRSLYGDPGIFRSVIDMSRYRFGRGEYKYFGYPLPSLVAALRESLYPPLAVVANQWMADLKIPVSYPPSHNEFISACRAAGQERPTPLMLCYKAGGYNTLHQDLYGDIYFPFQVVFVLTQQGEEHEGGELVFVEQLPRAQSRAEVVGPGRGDAVIFTTNFRPVKGTKGFYRARMKHGISPVKNGVRYALGLIFHDAR